MINRNLSSLARINTLLKTKNGDDRKARTRTLIQAGGLVSLSGLLSYCDIEEGEDLQLDMNSRDKSALLLGILLDAMERLSDPNDDSKRERFKQAGITLLKQSTAKTVYQKNKYSKKETRDAPSNPYRYFHA